ncbi:MAG: VOC family protein [Calditrichaeota bacterium]|nr:VOC family protein [Calditrichota bacterium]RQW01593.1 MAG: VOC family protein [Calditrichota bacterium]
MVKKVILTLVIITIFSCTSGEKTKERMQTGNYFQISLSSENLQTSLDFYLNLGFSEIEVYKDAAVPWAIISDGFNIYMLSQNKFPSPALNYYDKNLEERLPALEEAGLKTEQTTGESGKLQSAVLIDPTGVGISLINMDSRGLPRPSLSDSLLTGRFLELSIPVPDLTESLIFWKNLGFHLVSEGVKPYPMTVLSDNQIRIGLHQTVVFTSPAITYSTTNPDQTKKELTDLGTEFESIPGYTNGIRFTSPDNQLFLIYSAREGI